MVAVDVGTGQLAEPLRSDPRVRRLEQTNLRDLTLAHVDERPVDLVVADVSFISLTLLLRPLTSVTAPDGRLLLLVKPQFEVGRERLAPGGVVRDDGLRRAAVDAWSSPRRTSAGRRGRRYRAGWPGSAGNQEYFLLLGPRARRMNMLGR